MRLQGNLQSVFDALYSMGVIEPVLKKDWSSQLHQLPQFQHRVSLAVDIANCWQHDREKMVYELGKFDEKTLEFLAMEVAREYADFHARKEIH